MLRLNSKAANLFAKIKEKIQNAVPLSPEDMVFQNWLRRMKHRLTRRAHYAARNSAYAYQSKRQLARNLRKIKKAESRGLDVFGRALVVAVVASVVAVSPVAAKCATPDCTNRQGEGGFVGDVCVPCAKAATPLAVSKVYSVKSNAARAAAKAGLDRSAVYAVDGGFAFNTPAVQS